MNDLKLNDKKEDFNLKELVIRYLRYWPWFVVSTIIFCSLSYLYLRYTDYTYLTKASILIKDDGNSSLSELAAFGDLGIVGGGLSKSAFENEIEILKSRKILSQVVDILNLRVRSFKEGKIKTVEIFENVPYSINVLNDPLQEKSFQFYIKILSDSKFEIKESKEASYKEFGFGEQIGLKKAEVIIIPKPELINALDINEGGEYLVKILKRESATNMLKGSLNIQTANKNSSIINISSVTANMDKAEATLNTLIDVYNNDAINDRNLVAQNTANFIDNRLSLITVELDSVELSKVRFNQENRIVDIAAESQINLGIYNQLYGERSILSAQNQILEDVKLIVDSQVLTDLIPVNLGFSSDDVSSNIADYNNLVINRNRLLETSTEKNPVVESLKQQLLVLKSNISASLENVSKSNKIKNADLLKRESTVAKKLTKVPSIEKSTRAIERQQGIKEALYLYLLQKREETAISLAVTAPKAKVVELAYSNKAPVGPKPLLFYAASIFFGVLIPLVIVYLIFLFDTKIHNRVDVEKEFPSLSILGEIPLLDSKEDDVIAINDRSVLSEAFRILRTNLSYFTQNNDKNRANVTFVTSTIKGEGKTFVAYNLALTLASTGKSVVLIGADIRNPQIHRYIDKDILHVGLSEYLFYEEVSIEEITNRSDLGDHKVDIILSGRIPPNPAELLMNGRFSKLIDVCKEKYDHVIVDTAPTLLVTDTLLISQEADTTVYVSRAQYTDKKLLQYPNELNRDGKLKNIAFVINGIKLTNFGYGSKYGYGYGYGQEKPSLMKRIMSKIGLNN